MQTASDIQIFNEKYRQKCGYFFIFIELCEVLPGIGAMVVGGLGVGLSPPPV